MAAGIAMNILVKGGDKGIAVLALSGGLFHMFNHSVFKGLYFSMRGRLNMPPEPETLKS